MKKPLILAVLSFAAIVAVNLTSCNDTDYKTWHDYTDWREANDAWYQEQKVSGKYQRYSPAWNEELEVLMRWENDRNATAGNLSPLFTSTVKVKYIGYLYDGTPFDSSYNNIDSVSVFTPSALIDGWQIALEQMHVGDKVEVIVPYEAGYGNAFSGSVNPFSMLRFEMELKDIPQYEIRH